MTAVDGSFLLPVPVLITKSSLKIHNVSTQHISIGQCAAELMQFEHLKMAAVYHLEFYK